MYTTTTVTLVQPGLLQPLPPARSQNPLSAYSLLQGLGWTWDACPALWHLEELPREHKQQMGAGCHPWSLPGVPLPQSQEEEEGGETAELASNLSRATPWGKGLHLPPNSPSEMSSQMPRDPPTSYSQLELSPYGNLDPPTTHSQSAMSPQREQGSSHNQSKLSTQRVPHPTQSPIS